MSQTTQEYKYISPGMCTGLSREGFTTKFQALIISNVASYHKSGHVVLFCFIFKYIFVLMACVGE